MFVRNNETDHWHVYGDRASLVRRDFHMLVVWLVIKEHTLERNFMNGIFVRRHFHVVVVLLVIKEHTLERNLMNVMFVGRDFHIVVA